MKSDKLPEQTSTDGEEKPTSKVYQIGTSWTGFSALRYLFIFGDSYSDVGYTTFRTRVTPSAAQPLGMEFPGMTFNEEGLPNWVGHLISKYCPPPRFNPSLKPQEQDKQYMQSPILVYDYAIGGQTVDGVRFQIENYFLPHLGTNPPEATWNASNSIFITWVGINDCGRYADGHMAIKELIAAQEKLYHAGARNFLFIDVPPIHRSPAIPKREEESSSSIYRNWNATLGEALEEFSKSHEDMSIFMFSSFEVFENVLNKPQDYGIKEKEVRKTGGAIWVDHLHPTSKMHDILASFLADFLGKIE
ncbi:hypothetical protein CVT25_012471 [Psilocybe cyanescens]|uniref:Carbohydrate esterase family 16 protein n=1 Tax=Psilocybe cyanescens TaxID=93625 RepID=A0A409XHE6_PSICY|nr:hypothetical protein CVT25_012471 [Psilocybe cyanescens]